MWEGVKNIQWSFLFAGNGPGIGLRTGKYEVYVDDNAGSAEPAIDNGI